MTATKQGDTQAGGGGLIAVGFWVAWVAVAFSGDCIVSSKTTAFDATFSLLVLGSLGMGCSMIACALASDRAWRLVGSLPAMVAVGLVCTLTTYGVGLGGFLPVPLFFLSAFVSGAAMGIFALRCAVLVSETPPTEAAVGTCMAVLGGVLGYALFSLIAIYHGNSWVLALTGLLPIAGILFSFFISSSGNSTELMHDEANDTLVPAFWYVVSRFALIALALSAVRGYYPHMIGDWEFASSRADAAFVLALMVLVVAGIVAGHGVGKGKCSRRAKEGPSTGDASSSVRLVYGMLVASMVFIIPAAGLGVQPGFSGSLATLAKGTLLVAVWCFANLWTYTTGMSAIRVYGFTLGAAMVSCFAGYAAGGALAAFLPADARIAFGAVIIVVCLASAFFLLRSRKRDMALALVPTAQMMEAEEGEIGGRGTDEAGMGMFAGASTGAIPEPASRAAVADKAVLSARPATDAASPAGQPAEGTRQTAKGGRFMARVYQVAENHDLSPRETEVLVLLAKHMDVKSVADELCISFNTARTHVRHVYAKLEVHNRRELEDLVDAKR